MKAYLNKHGVILRDVPDKSLLKEGFWEDLLDELRIPASSHRVKLSTSWDSARQCIAVRQDIYLTDKTAPPNEAVAILKKHGFEVMAAGSSGEQP